MESVINVENFYFAYNGSKYHVKLAFVENYKVAL